MAVIHARDAATGQLVELAKAEDSAHTSGDHGIMVLGVRNDTQAAFSSANGDYTPLMVSTRGEVFIVPVKSSLPGLFLHRTISAASTNATSAKASQGNLYSILAVNTNAAARYLKLYNKATAPTVGTDTPVMTIILPPSVPIEITTSIGWGFSLGIAFALTTGIADTDTNAVAANEIVVNLGYA
ncbi:MAG: hypothetical protein AB7Q01_08645 [Gammaproteobacteria bacterium]